MARAATRDEFEERFTVRVTLVSSLLDDLTKVTPTAVTVADDATLEDAFELHDSNAKSVNQVVLDSTEALDDGDVLRKEMRAYFESLDQASQVIYTKWVDTLNKALKWDTSTRTVRKQRREHITIMAASQAAAAKAKRELDRTMPVPATPPPVAPVALLRSEAKLAPIQIPDFYGDKKEFTSYWDQFETLVDKCPSIGKTQKFVNFRRSLHGPALRKIQHLRTTEANYEIAKDTIKRWYGDEEAVIRTLRSELMAMRDWRGRMEVKEKFDIAESYIQQLSTLIGEEYNAPEALDVLMRCLPYSYVERIQVFKN